MTQAIGFYGTDGFGERVAIGTGGGCLGICGGGGSVYSSFIFGRGGELLVENNGSGQPLRSYVYLNGLPLALVDGAGNIDYILADQVGQPQKMVDGFGTLVWDRVPDVFGATVAQPVGMTAANPLRFPGQEYDAVTGLHYNHFREYDPSLGRYVQSDPIGLAGGINTYAYAGGNPLRFTDPSGEGPLGAAIGAIIGALLEGVPTEGVGAVEGALEGARLGSLVEDLYDAAHRGATVRSAAGEAAAGPGGELAGMCAAGAAERGVSVLGHFPGYVNTARSIGARYFNVPPEVWAEMTPEEQWAANTRFLDRLIERGDTVVLSTPASQAAPNSFFARELEYLTSRGYTLSSDGMRLLPPGP